MYPDVQMTPLGSTGFFCVEHDFDQIPPEHFHQYESLSKGRKGMMLAAGRLVPSRVISVIFREQLIAWVLWTKDDFFVNVFTAEPYRKKGIASALLDQVRAYADCQDKSLFSHFVTSKKNWNKIQKGSGFSELFPSAEKILIDYKNFLNSKRDSEASPSP